RYESRFTDPGEFTPYGPWLHAPPPSRAVSSASFRLGYSGEDSSKESSPIFSKSRSQASNPQRNQGLNIFEPSLGRKEYHGCYLGENLVDREGNSGSSNSNILSKWVLVMRLVTLRLVNPLIPLIIAYSIPNLATELSHRIAHTMLNFTLSYPMKKCPQPHACKPNHNTKPPKFPCTHVPPMHMPNTPLTHIFPLHAQTVPLQLHFLRLTKYTITQPSQAPVFLPKPNVTCTSITSSLHLPPYPSTTHKPKRKYVHKKPSKPKPTQ
ncbi:hypothetical protein Salat_2886500, partial [Sesamum alatum]